MYLDVFADRHGFGRRIRAGLHRRLDRRLGIPLFDTDISTVATRLDNPTPLLVVHDPEDPDSSYADSEHIVGVLARRDPGDHPRTWAPGALPHLAASPRDQRRVEFIGSAPIACANTVAEN